MADLINDVRLLLVDDTRTARDVYTRLLTANGYRIETADSVQEGLKKLAASAFDIVIIDYFMPQENGDVLCRAIRQDARLGHISPVILTATYSDEIIRLSLEAGASDCLFKDEPEELLLARIAAMVRSIRVRKTIDIERLHLAQILGSLSEGVYGVGRDTHITFMNSAGLKILGFDHEDEVRGRNPHELLHFAQIDGRPNPPETCFLMQAYELGDELLCWDSVFWTRDRQPLWVECNVVPMLMNGQHQGSVVAFRDITMLREQIDKLNWQAYHDSLTRLPNRRYFTDVLEREFYRLKRSDEVSGLLYIDLDEFKAINDAAGHAAGDQLLVEIGQLLARRIRGADVLARLGGDEFGIILPNVNADNLVNIAEEFRALIADYRFNYRERTFRVSGSVGASLINKHSTSPEQVLSQADTASYTAKRRGDCQAQLYVPTEEGRTGS